MRSALVLVVLVLFPFSNAVRGETPPASWEASFDDETEAREWTLHPSAGPLPHVEWSVEPRNASVPDGEHVLRIQAGGTPGHLNLYRLFGPGFRPHHDGSLVLDWEWMIKDVETSGAVGIDVLCDTTGVEIEDLLKQTLMSHSRYTHNWRVFFDPANRFVSHRARTSRLRTIGGEPCDPIGVAVMLQAPVNQVVSISRLRVEEHTADGTAWSEIYRPHRPPPPEAPFAETPVNALRRSTAGALEDLDLDGFPDLLLLERRGYAHLYLNDGTGGFHDEITRASGLLDSYLATGAMWIDLDGDRDRDLVITAEFDTPRLYENVGDLRLEERVGLGEEWLDFWYSAAADDVDGDGDPDVLFVSPYGRYAFLQNDGDWRFRPVTRFESAAVPDLSFSASFADLDQDRWPDVVIGGERVLFNDHGDLRPGLQPWAERDDRKVEGTVLADLTADGVLDALILRDTAESTGPTRFLVGDAHGGFEDRTAASGLPSLPSAEVALAEDFDNSGSLDLYICQSEAPNYLLLNDGSGRFRNATEQAGLIDEKGCDSAVAGDIDGDGAMDVVIFRYGTAPAILRNALAVGSWIEIAAAGVGDMNEPIGDAVRVIGPVSGTAQVRWPRRGRGFGSVGPAALHFGLGNMASANVEVSFRSGRTRVVRDVVSGSRILVRDAAGPLSGIVARTDEWLFPGRLAFRRAMARRPRLAWGVAAVAFTLAAGATIVARGRVPLGIALVLGLLLMLAMGGAPGRGLAGSPPWLWWIGGAAGVMLPLSVRGARVVLHRIREPAGGPRRSPGELIRRTMDFRHSGIGTRTLLSIHSRTQNLFLGGRLHPPFLEGLRELGGRFCEQSGEELRGILELAAVTCPGVRDLEPVRALLDRLFDRLRELPEVADDDKRLAEWRAETLPMLEQLDKAIPELTRHIDEACSCDLPAVIDEVLDAAAVEIRAAGVDTVVRRRPTAGTFVVVADRQELQFVFENLVTNALDALAGRPDRRIEIDIRSHAKTVETRVRDTGRGIPDEHAAEAFAYGFSTRAGGKGYGLARSREILGQYGASIDVVQEPGWSTVFRIRLREP